MVKRIHASHTETKIVLVDLHPGLLSEVGISGSPIICLQSDMTSIESLKKATCNKARLILLASENDAFNLKAAYKIIRLNPHAEVLVCLHHNGLTDIMDLTRKPNLHFFSPYQ